VIAKPNSQALGRIAGWAAAAGAGALAIDALTSVVTAHGWSGGTFSPGPIIAAGSACMITALALWRSQQSAPKDHLEQAIAAAKTASGVTSHGTLSLALSTDPAQQDALEAELYKRITTEPLTEIANRRHFMARLEETIAQMQREPDRHVALITFSLQGEVFDHANLDRDPWLGASEGISSRPAVLQDGLRRLAQCCRDSLRPGDIISRMEGTRFAVLLPNAKPRAAMACAERLRTAMDRLPLSHDGVTPMPYYAAFGVATLKGGETGHELVERCLQAEATARQRQDMVLFASNAPPLRETLTGGMA
jgi:GGDEF domain-containing protein